MSLPDSQLCNATQLFLNINLRYAYKDESLPPGLAVTFSGCSTILWSSLELLGFGVADIVPKLNAQIMSKERMADGRNRSSQICMVTKKGDLMNKLRLILIIGSRNWNGNYNKVIPKLKIESTDC